MKKQLGFLALFLILVCTAHAQTPNIRTEAGKRLTAVEAEIKEAETKLQTEEARLRDLRTRYDDEYKENQAALARIGELNKYLVALNLERKNLLTKQLIMPLPKDNTALLQMIVVQNDRILELLGKLAGEKP